MKAKPIICLAGICCILIGLGSLMVTESTVFQRHTITQITADGVEHRFDVYEPLHSEFDEKPVVLLCHGFSVSKEFFANFAIEYANLGYLAITMELRGHGNSRGDLLNGSFAEWFFDADLSQGLINEFIDIDHFQSEVDSVFEYIDSRDDVNKSAISLVGHSMGGGVVLQTAQRYPDRVLSTVTLAPLPVSGLNATTPRNFLLVLGALDEAFSLDDELPLFMETVDVEEVEFGKLYGDFADGSARKFVYTMDNHASEYVNPTVVLESIRWTQSGIEYAEQSMRMSDLLYLTRLLSIGIAILGLLVAVLFGGLWLGEALPFSHNLSEIPSKTISLEEPKKFIGIAIATTLVTLPLSLLLIFPFILSGYVIPTFIIAFISALCVNELLLMVYVDRKSELSVKELASKIFNKEHFNPKNLVCELVLGLGFGLFFLYGFQLAFGQYFVNIWPAIWRFGAVIFFFIFGVVLLLIHEFFMRFFLPSVFPGLRLDQKDSKKETILSKNKIVGISFAIIAGFLTLSFVLTALWLNTTFVYMILVLVLPVLLLFLILQAFWFESSKRLLWTVLPLAVIIGGALVAISPFAVLW